MAIFLSKKLIPSKNSKKIEKTFLQMYDFYAPKIFRHIYYRMSQQKEIAQDLTQQVFFKTWRYLAETENKIDNFQAFLYKIANNLVIDYYRKAERKDIALNNGLERKLSSEPSYIIETNQNLELSQIKKALNQLNPESQQILIWRYIDDLSIKEIAQLSKKTKNAIYVAIHRGLKELQNLISSKQ